MRSQAYLPAWIKTEEPLAPRTSFGIGGAAGYYCEVAQKERLLGALDWARRMELPVYPLAGGSNILVADDGVEALVVRPLEGGEFDGLEFSADGASVRAGAAVPTAELVSRAVAGGFAGLEFLAGIPGLVSGAVASNAGGRFGRVEEVLIGFEGVRLDAGDSEVYRLTHFHDAGEFFVLSAEFRVEKRPLSETAAREREVMEYRERTQPIGARSAGCIFANPSNNTLSAGELIERAGFKGKARGGAMVSEKHANWLINTGSASAQDVASLALEIVETVRERFGIQLAFEIDLWGESLEEFLVRRGYLA